MSLPNIMVNDNFTTIINNKSYSVTTEHPKYDTLLEAVLVGDAECFLNNFTIEKVTKTKFKDSGVTIENGVICYNGEPVHNEITRRIVNFVDRDLPTDGLIAFLDNLMENPSRCSVEELYGFLQHKNLPITDDGHFLAYKAVRENYMDKFSGTFDNNVGNVMEMPRNKVDDVASNTCSVGFHVGALEYAGPGGAYHNSSDRVIIVKVNPKDAVSVPTDHSAQKLRVCRYEVIGEYEKPLDDDYVASEPDDSNTERDAAYEAESLRADPYDIRDLLHPYTEVDYFIDDYGLWDEPDDDLFDSVRQLDDCEEKYEHSHVVHSDHLGNRRRYHARLRRRMHRTNRHYVTFDDGSSAVICYNSDNSPRWAKSTRRWSWQTDFVRYSDAY